MFLKKDKRPNGRIYLSIDRAFRDPITQKPKQRAVMSVGFLDELLNQYDDPIAHFEKLAAEMTAEGKRNLFPLLS